MTEETIKEILKFRDDRDWKKFHNPKDLAISISLEAAELLEVFQWSGADVSNEGKQEKIREELADVVNYCVLMADACGLDLDEIVREKKLTTIMVTHNLRHAVEYGNRLVMMHEGSIIMDQSGAEKAKTRMEDLLAIFNSISVECGKNAHKKAPCGLPESSL